MRLEETRGLSHLIFDSTGEALDYALEHRKDAPNSHYNACSSDRIFTGTSDYLEAHNLASKGWQLGRDKVEEFRKQLDISGKVQRQIIANDVVGDCWDMGKVMSGEPECAMYFETTDDVSGHGPIVSMVVNVSSSGGIDTDLIVRRGAAILALVDALESAGKRVEIWASKINYSGYGDFRIDIPLKKADEPFELDKMSFALTHPSMNRRIMFSLTYMCGTNGKMAASGSYGMASNYKPDCDIYLPRLDDRNAWPTNDSAITWITTQLEKYGVKLND